MSSRMLKKSRQLCSRIAQRLNVPQGYVSPLRSLRPRWTAILSILQVAFLRLHSSQLDNSKGSDPLDYSRFAVIRPTDGEVHQKRLWIEIPQVSKNHQHLTF